MIFTLCFYVFLVVCNECVLLVKLERKPINVTTKCFINLKKKERIEKPYFIKSKVFCYVKGTVKRKNNMEWKNKNTGLAKKFVWGFP